MVSAYICNSRSPSIRCIFSLFALKLLYLLFKPSYFFGLLYDFRIFALDVRF